MGLLDSSDDDVKNNLKYKNVVASMKNLDESVEAFKKAGGSPGLVQRVAQALVRCFRELKKAEEAYPSFAEWKEHRKAAEDVLEALKGKYPDHPWTAKAVEANN